MCALHSEHPITMSESHHILKPHNALRDIYSPRTVLVIAAEGCLDVPDDLKTFTEGSNGLNVHFAKKLPLPCGNNHPPIDLVVFVCKVFSSDGLQAVKDSMPFLDVRYLVGKCLILIYSDDEFSLEDTEEITGFAEGYHIPVHYTTKTKPLDAPNSKPRLQLQSDLLRVYCPTVGSDVNSLIIDAAMSQNVSAL